MVFLLEWNCFLGVMSTSLNSRALLWLERSVQKSHHHRWCNCSSIKENTGYKGMNSHCLVIAAHHRKMSQHLETIDHYGHIVSLKLLPQRQLKK